MNLTASPTVTIERHHQFNGVEAVRTKVFDEASAVVYLLGIDVQVFDYDLLYALSDVAHFLIAS